jgi:hypothetical protein
MGCASNEMCLGYGRLDIMRRCHWRIELVQWVGGIGSWERGNDAEHPFTICSRDLKLAGIFPSVFTIP